MQGNTLNRFVKSVNESKAVSFRFFTGARLNMLVENVDKDRIVRRTPLELVIRYNCESRTQEYGMFHIDKGTEEDVSSELTKLFSKPSNPRIQYAFMSVKLKTKPSFCHMNTLIFSYKDSTVRLFEPHGTPRVNLAERIGVFFRDIMPRSLNVKKWTFKDMRAAPGKNHEGLQVQGERGGSELGLCVLWNLYVVQHIIRNGLNIRHLYNKRNNLRKELLEFFEPFWEKVKFKNVYTKETKHLYRQYVNRPCDIAQPIDLTHINFVNLTDN